MGGVEQSAVEFANETSGAEDQVAPAATVAAIVVDQFDEKDRVDALARLKISDPGSLAAEVEGAFLEIVEAARRSKVVKLANVAGKAVGLGKQGKALGGAALCVRG